MESKYNRTVATSLLAFSDLLSVIYDLNDEAGGGDPAAAVEKAALPTLEEAAKSQRFWKMATCKVSLVSESSESPIGMVAPHNAIYLLQVRQSWYKLLATVMTSFPVDLAVSTLGSSKICSYTFNQLDDLQDPVSLCAVWDATLAVVAKWEVRRVQSYYYSLVFMVKQCCLRGFYRLRTSGSWCSPTRSKSGRSCPRLILPPFSFSLSLRQQSFLPCAKKMCITSHGGSYFAGRIQKSNRARDRPTVKFELFVPSLEIFVQCKYIGRYTLLLLR